MKNIILATILTLCGFIYAFGQNKKTEADLGINNLTNSNEPVFLKQAEAIQKNQIVIKLQFKNNKKVSIKKVEIEIPIRTEVFNNINSVATKPFTTTANGQVITLNEPVKPGDTFTVALTAMVAINSNISIPIMATIKGKTSSQKFSQKSNIATLNITKVDLTDLKSLLQCRNTTQNSNGFGSFIRASTGDEIEFLAEITNIGPFTTCATIIMEDLVHELDLKSDSIIIDWSSFAGSLSQGIRIKSISPGQTIRIIYRKIVRPNPPNTSIINTIRARASNTNPTSNSVQITIVPK